MTLGTEVELGRANGVCGASSTLTHINTTVVPVVFLVEHFGSSLVKTDATLAFSEQLLVRVILKATLVTLRAMIALWNPTGLGGKQRCGDGW